jgi:hypothetical protein
MKIYIHVSNRNLRNIKSPLNLILKKSYVEKKIEGDGN